VFAGHNYVKDKDYIGLEKIAKKINGECGMEA
jgi:hypothetical protein